MFHYSKNVRSNIRDSFHDSQDLCIYNSLVSFLNSNRKYLYLCDCKDHLHNALLQRELRTMYIELLQRHQFSIQSSLQCRIQHKFYLQSNKIQICIVNIQENLEQALHKNEEAGICTNALGKLIQLSLRSYFHLNNSNSQMQCHFHQMHMNYNPPNFLY